MAFEQNLGNNAGPSRRFTYTSLMGAFVEQTPEHTEILKEMRTFIGDEEVRKGFTGNSGNTAKAREFLRGKNMPTIQNITGRLSSAFIREVDLPNGGKSKYLNVVMKDKNEQGVDETYYISAPFESPGSSSGAHRLIRKLVNAKIGVETKLNLFASYDKSESATTLGQYFANHAASLVQEGAEVKIAEADDLRLAITAAEDALKKANMNDPKLLKQARFTTVLDYHAGLMDKFVAKAEEFYKANGTRRPGTPGDETHTQAQTAAAMESPKPATPAAASIEDWEDDIPF